GPFRAFFDRIRSRRGPQIAVVALARKLATLVWYLISREQDYLWARPALVAWKYRRLELRAGAPRRPGQRGAAANYWASPATRQQDRARCIAAEDNYQRFTSNWKIRIRSPEAQPVVEATTPAPS